MRSILRNLLIATAFASVAPLAAVAGCSGNDPVLGLRQPRPPPDSGPRDASDATMQGDAPNDAPAPGDAATDTTVADAPADTAADASVMDAPADGAD